MSKLRGFMLKCRWLVLAMVLCGALGGWALYVLSGHWSMWVELGGRRYGMGNVPLVPGNPDWCAATLKKNPSIAKLFIPQDGRTEFESRGGKVGYVDDHGDIVIPAQFDMTWDFKGDRALVAFRGEMALIDGAGHFVFGPDKNIDVFDSKPPDHFVVKYTDGHSVEIDHDGKLLRSETSATKD